MDIKQDINFFEKPLWFQSDQSNSEGFVWEDQNGYVYSSIYKVPTHLDILFLMYFLKESQNQDYSGRLNLTRYQVIKNCSLPIQSTQYYERLEDSLKRWLHVSIAFDKCFYENGEKVSRGFHIVDSYEIDGKDIYIRLNAEWLGAIKESNFFKYINFNYYKALKKPISRRLFEILCKTFKNRDLWEIELVKLGSKLTLQGRKKKVKGEIKEVLYPSAVFASVKSAINEINKQVKDKELFEDSDPLENKAFLIDYELDKTKKIIKFIKKVPKWKSEEKLLPSSKKSAGTNFLKDKQNTTDSDLQLLFKLCKSRAKVIRALLKKTYEQEGMDYVKWNILYANEKATKNYAAFLKKAIKEDWGAELRENKKAEENKLETKKEAKVKKEKRILKAYKGIDIIVEEYKSLTEEQIDYLEPLAVQKCLEIGLKEEFIPKITLMEKIVECYREEKRK